MEPPRPVNRDYWYCGGPTLQPVAASDDGVQTRLTFSARGEWPAIFVRNEDGSESLLNFHAEGTTAVVHRVAPEFVLRRGRLVGCVENRGYAGSGVFLPSGTSERRSRARGAAVSAVVGEDGQAGKGGRRWRPRRRCRLPMRLAMGLAESVPGVGGAARPPRGSLESAVRRG